MDSSGAIDDGGVPSGVAGLGELAGELKPSPLTPMASGALATTIRLLAGGDVTIYVQTDREGGIDRLAVVTDDLTVRVLMLTSGWSWKGPYTPDDPHEWAEARGYEPAPEVTVDG